VIFINSTSRLVEARAKDMMNLENTSSRKHEDVCPVELPLRSDPFPPNSSSRRLVACDYGICDCLTSTSRRKNALIWANAPAQLRLEIWILFPQVESLVHSNHPAPLPPSIATHSHKLIHARHRRIDFDSVLIRRRALKTRCFMI
jgi:hypothetical protein